MNKNEMFDRVTITLHVAEWLALVYSAETESNKLWPVKCSVRPEFDCELNEEALRKMGRVAHRSAHDIMRHIGDNMAARSGEKD